MGSYSPSKTAAWMAREGVSGTAEEIAHYATDWQTVREKTGISLGLERERIPTLPYMLRQAERIARERTRTRVLGGRRIFVQVRDAMTFGREFGVPGIYVGAVETDEPDTEWEVVPRSWFDTESYPALRSRVYREPIGRWQFHADRRNSIGSMGAMVFEWPDEAEILVWAEARAASL